VLIYWDQYFTNTPAAVTSMDQFVSDLASGGYWSGLGQYGVGSVSLQGHVVINMSRYPTPNSRNPGIPFTEAQMQSQLITWLNDGVVTPRPAGNEENLVYLIVAPSDTTLSQNGQTSGFCGYHQHGRYNATTSRDNLIWGTVQGYTQAATGQAFVNSISYCVSHEFSEAFSNPDGQGYFNDNGCEIGDICEAPANGPCCTTVPYTTSGRTWSVETYWSNRDAACIIGRSLPVTTAGRSGFFIQSRFGQPERGNFELVVPLITGVLDIIGGLGHFFRDNDAPGLPWSNLPLPAVEVIVAGDTFDAVSLIQSNFSASGNGPGNLEVIARAGDRLFGFFRPDNSLQWQFAGAPTGTGFTGNPALIQSRFGTQGNFELIVPLSSGGIAHFFRDNDAPGLPWSNLPLPAVEVFGTGMTFDAVSLIQSNFSASGNGPGNLEVIARAGDRLFGFFRPDNSPQWQTAGAPTGTL
jgi:hypothetical protein